MEMDQGEGLLMSTRADTSFTPTWMHPGGQEVSVLDAILTVSPNRQNLRRIFPTIPDMTGPLWRPTTRSRARRQRGLLAGAFRIGECSFEGYGAIFPHLSFPPILSRSVEPSSVSGLCTFAASCRTLSAKRTMVVACCGSGLTRLAATCESGSS